jgi:hypothetical protein
MNRNVANGLSHGLGQIYWQGFIAIWKTTGLVSNVNSQSENPDPTPSNALLHMCQELGYPSGWASIPPLGFNKTSKMKID